MSCTKRRQKAANRRRWVSDLRVARGLMPLDAISVMKCSCGRTMWLREGASAQDVESFDRDAMDHADYCGEDQS